MLIVLIPENLNSGRILRKFRFWSKFWEISILVDVLQKILILAKIFENLVFFRVFVNYLDFGQKFWKSRFWSKFPIISILVKIDESLDIGQKFWRISIIVKIFENLDFG